MHITREAYNAKPLLIKQGALVLWGIQLGKWTSNSQIHHLYRLNDFYAEMNYDKKSGRLMGISTFTSPHRLAPYLHRMNLHRIDQSL